MQAFPPDYWEILNWARSTVCLIVFSLAAYVITAEYRRIRRGEPPTAPPVSRADAFKSILQFRLAIATVITFFGEFLITLPAALIRYLESTGGDVSWASERPFIFLPIFGGVTMVIGGACIARSIIPRIWGRCAYLCTIGAVLAVVIASRIFR